MTTTIKDLEEHSAAHPFLAPPSLHSILHHAGNPVRPISVLIPPRALEVAARVAFVLLLRCELLSGNEYISPPATSLFPPTPPYLRRFRTRLRHCDSRVSTASPPLPFPPPPLRRPLRPSWALSFPVRRAAPPGAPLQHGASTPRRLYTDVA